MLNSPGSPLNIKQTDVVVVPIHGIDPCAFESNANRCMMGIWIFGKTILACPRQRISNIGYSIPRIIHLFPKSPFLFHA